MFNNNITNFLDDNHIEYELKLHDNEVYTCEDAAFQRDVKISQIVKCILLSSKKKYYYLALLPGDKRLNTSDLKKITKEKSLNFVNSEKLINVFDLIPGAVSPLSQKLDTLPKFMDRKIFDEDLVDISSGDPKVGIELESKSLLEVLQNVQVVDISL